MVRFVRCVRQRLRSNGFLERYIKSLLAFIHANFARHVNEALGLRRVVLLVCFSCWHGARFIRFRWTRQFPHDTPQAGAILRSM